MTTIWTSIQHEMNDKAKMKKIDIFHMAKRIMDNIPDLVKYTGFTEKQIQYLIALSNEIDVHDLLWEDREINLKDISPIDEISEIELVNIEIAPVNSPKKCITSHVVFIDKNTIYRYARIENDIVFPGIVALGASTMDNIIIHHINKSYQKRKNHID